MALVFPIVWRCLDIYGVAKIDLAFHDIVHDKDLDVSIVSLHVLVLLLVGLPSCVSVTST